MVRERDGPSVWGVSVVSMSHVRGHGDEAVLIADPSVFTHILHSQTYPTLLTQQGTDKSLHPYGGKHDKHCKTYARCFLWVFSDEILEPKVSLDSFLFLQFKN